MSIISHHFNHLSPAEAERLAITAEECGEAVQAIGKILRHGYESTHPASPAGPTNRENLAKELADVMLCINILLRRGDIDPVVFHEAYMKKADTVKNYLHHQDPMTDEERRKLIEENYARNYA